MIVIPGPDERTWRINGRPVDMHLEALSWEELHLLLQKLEEHLSKSLKARRLVRRSNTYSSPAPRSSATVLARAVARR